MDSLCSEQSLLRLSMNRVPNSQDLARELGIPLALVVKPFG